MFILPLWIIYVFLDIVADLYLKMMGDDHVFLRLSVISLK